MRGNQIKIEALLGLRSWEIGLTEPSAARTEVNQEIPENSKAGPEEMEAMVVTFKQGFDKIEVTNMEATSEAMEAAVEWRELCNEQVKDAVGSLEDQHMEQHLVVRRHQWVKKWTQGNGRVWQSWPMLKD
jgi:histidinol dehydrogenase